MAKLIKESEHSKFEVGLSCYAQSHRKRINDVSSDLKHFVEVQSFVTGESKIKYKTTFNSQSKPPKRDIGSEVIQTGLTLQAKSKIKLASRCIQYINESVKGRSGKASFITLTYGKDVPDHKTAKTQLDNFLKRCRRYYGRNFEYVWCAELQKRGAIHFHICSVEYIKKSLVNNWWNEIVNKWSESHRNETQKLYPHVKGVMMAGSYMAKYMTKEGGKIAGNLYGISTPLRELMKPNVEAYRVANEMEGKEALDIVQGTLENLGLMARNWNAGTTRQIWTNNGSQVLKTIETDLLTRQERLSKID